MLITNNGALQGYGAVIGQGEASPMPQIDNGGMEGEFQRVWNTLRTTCIQLIGADHCTRMLGTQPFICPTDDKPKVCNIKTLLIAGGIGLVIGKIIL